MALYDNYMPHAMAGMKADLGIDRVETFPCGATAIPFGVIVGTDATGVLVPGAGTKARGGAVHSHAIIGQYEQYSAVSVMTRGHMWLRVTAAGVCTENGPVKFATDGTVSDGGAATMPNAVFRKREPSQASVIVDGPNGQKLVLVEFHSPQV